MTEYYLFGAGWNGFGITREDGMDSIFYTPIPEMTEFNEPGDPTPDFKSIEFIVKSIKDNEGVKYFIACHECDPDPKEVLRMIKK